MGVRKDYYMKAGLKAFTVRLPERTVDLLDVAARSLGRRATRGDVVEEAVERYLKIKRVALPEEYDERVEEAS